MAGDRFQIRFETPLDVETERPLRGAYNGVIQDECTGLGAVVNAVAVTIGGVNTTVTFAGLVPGSTGLYQIGATVPSGVASGDAVPVQITVAGQTGPAVTMAIK